MSTQYPEDEFDRAAEDMPMGLHRPPPSRWRSVVPFFLLLFLVVVIGWFIPKVLMSTSGKVNTATIAPSVAASSSALPKTEKTAENSQPTKSESAPASKETLPADETKDKPSATPTPSSNSAAANKVASVRVLNGTTTGGLAAKRAEALSTAGFANVSPDNAGPEWKARISTVYYGTENMSATAQEVARVLGVAKVELNPQVVTPDSITVLLRN